MILGSLLVFLFFQSCSYVKSYYSTQGGSSCSSNCINSTSGCLSYTNNPYTICQNCTAGSFRTLNNGSCPCDPGYFDNNQTTCVACNYSCGNCQNYSTNCSTCNSTTRSFVNTSGQSSGGYNSWSYSFTPQYNYNGSCPCKGGYFENGVVNCVPCSYTCGNCTASSTTSCTTCQTVSYRSLYINGSCTCNPGYYDNGTATCAICNYQCGTCNGGTNQSCTDCNSTTSFRTLNTISISNLQCGCNAGYIDNGVESCVPCSSSCGNCTGSSSTSCTTCQMGSQRSLNSGSCTCNPGFYDNGVAICAACNIQCGTCNGGTNQSCTNCNSTTSFRTLNTISSTNIQCGCNTGYFDNGVENCVLCSYQCGNCTASSTTSCTTCQMGSQRSLNSSSCTCNPGFYDNGVAICATCNYQCGTCNGGSNQTCTNCNSTTSFRTLNTISSTNNQCGCNAGYFDNGVENCVPCSSTCGNCTGSSTTSCATCQTGTFRSLNSGSCTCNQGYYDNGVAICVVCNYQCGTCNGASNQSCTNCNSTTSFRTMNTISSSNIQCGCNQGYFDNGVENCVACSFTCGNCTASSTTSCTTCQTGSYRSLYNDGSCTCNPGFYDNGVAICAACNYQCGTCNGGSNQTCTNCNSTTSFRTLNTISSTNIQCGCNAGYFDNGVENCVPCSPTCGNCTASSSNSCATCQTGTFRSLNSGSCTCNPGFYDNGVAICATCNYQCGTCNGASNQTCTSCNSSTSFRTLNTISSSNLQCGCNAGYFDNGFENCVACSFTCGNCTASSTTSCTTCQTGSYRSLYNNGSCTCNPEFYDNGVAICAACNYQCGTCNGGSNQTCTNCNSSTSFRTLNTISGTNVQCGCNGGYFDNGLENCVSCSITCGNCTGTSTTSCTTCQPSSVRTLNSGSCSCNPGFYDNGAAICAACNYQCGTCNGGTNQTCLECNSTTSFRTLNTISSNNIQCGCNAGYFDNGVENCVACSTNCGNCTGSSTSSCTTCQANSFRTLNSGSCSCNSGYYDDGSSITCLQCSYSCGNCTAGTNQSCSTCIIGSFRTLNSTSCLCDQGYYDNGSSTTCNACSSTCLTCTAGTTSNCSSCLSNSHRTFANGQCSCNSGYFSQGTQAVCVACSNTCATCSSASSQACLSCSSMSFRSLVNNSCVCISGYSQNSSQPNCLKDPKNTSNTCGDGSLSLEEQCDDGNNIGHDGCSKLCKVNSGFQCSVQMNVSGCTLSPILDCISIKTETLNSNIPLCHMCSNQYFVSNDGLSCIACDVNCDGCTGSKNSQCKKCAISAMTVTSESLTKGNDFQTSCESCEAFLGLYSQNKGPCDAYCGDAIVRYDKGEQCDDGNNQSNDGCSSQCQVEASFRCSPQKPSSKQPSVQLNNYQDFAIIGPSKCDRLQSLNATLSYTNDSSNDQLILLFNGIIQQTNFCQKFQMKIETLDRNNYSFKSVQKSSNSCLVTISFNVSLIANEPISVSFNESITDQDKGSLVTNPVMCDSKQYSFYSVQQKQQAQQVVEAQSNINLLILILGLLVIIFGGVQSYFRILDMLTWVDTLYYVNVNYPLNVKIFFQYASWLEIFCLPDPVRLNQPADPYYQSGPQKFNDKGINGCFLASVTGDVYFFIGGVLVYSFCSSISLLLEHIYTKVTQDKSKSLAVSQLTSMAQTIGNEDKSDVTQKGQLQVPAFLQPLYEYCKSIKDSYVTILVKLLLLVNIDFQMASMLQIQAGQYSRHPFIMANLLMAWIFQIGGLYIPIYFSQIIDNSPMMLEFEPFEEKYGQIYEDILINTHQGKFYTVFAVVKKFLFVAFLVYFYDRPILQTIFCCLTCSVNLMVMCSNSVFQSNKYLFLNLIPELAIFLATAITMVFALDDKTNILSAEFKYNLGWFVLSSIFCSLTVQIGNLIYLVVKNIISKLRMVKRMIGKLF